MWGLWKRPYGIDNVIYVVIDGSIDTEWKRVMMSLSTEKIVVFRRVWKAGKGKYAIYIPKEIVEHYKLEGKFVKGILEVIENESTTTE
jgi:hypothetical protein